MMINFLQRYLRNLRFANQILILQGITIGLILMILFWICFFMIKQFKEYFQDELLESIIQKSVISSVQLKVGQFMTLSLLTSMQQGNLFAAQRDLYNFQLSNNITINQPLDDCENPHKLNSKQFCINGTSNDNTQELSQFKQFIQLQNTLVPFKFNQFYFLEFYNILLSDQLVYTTQMGESKPIFDKNLLVSYYYMKTYNLMLLVYQVQQAGEQHAYVFYVLPGTRIAHGSLNDVSQPFQNLDNNILKVRAYLVLETGLIITDTESAQVGQYFQNISGFNNHQFEIIKNRTLGIGSKSECEQSASYQILCLINDQKMEKFIFSKYFMTEQIQYVIIVTDGSFIRIIREEFNEQFNNFINTQIQIIVSQVFTILGICIPIQVILIIKLRRPLKQLIEIAQYNINHNQYKLLNLIRTKDRNQIQQLQDSYFDLINQSKSRINNHLQQYENKKLYYHNLGQLQKHEEKRVTQKIKAIIQYSLK